MKIYLSGPMTGIKDWNFPAFFGAAQKLRDAGHQVFNPAENEREPGPENEDYRYFLRTDLNWILDHAEAIALLPGWENSKGVAAELALSKALGLEVIHVEA